MASPPATLPKVWTLKTLPPAALAKLLTRHVVKDAAAHRRASSLSGGLFALQEEEPLEVASHPLLWATDHYEALGEPYAATNPLHDPLKVVPRVEKSQEEQKRRVKAKAEVFTPTWLVNLQNNLIDDALLGEGAFNLASVDARAWRPTEGPVAFPETYPWTTYLTDRRLEVACGEGPYLFSPYDATSGVYLPVLDAEGRFQRVGLLDRKLRVAVEKAGTPEEWKLLAFAALRSIYGYEWQGDNLLLARLNFVNSYFDYYRVYCELNALPWPPKEGLEAAALEVAEIASWQLWQMDGLRQVTPLSCSVSCRACLKKNLSGHDGELPVIPWGAGLKPFDAFLEGRTKK